MRVQHGATRHVGRLTKYNTLTGNTWGVLSPVFTRNHPPGTSRWAGAPARARTMGFRGWKWSAAAAVLAASTLSIEAQDRPENPEFARRIRNDGALGYQHMTIQHYAQNIPMVGTKVAIPAHVSNVSTIVDNGRIYMINRAQPHAAARVSANIILGNAPEAAQNKVLRCLRAALMHLPCSMMVLGTVDICEGILFGVKKITACIVVDDAWNMAEVGTYQQAIELKIDLPSKN